MKHQAVLEKAIVTRIIKTLKNKPHVVVRKRHGTAMGWPATRTSTAPSTATTSRSRSSGPTTRPPS